MNPGFFRLWVRVIEAHQIFSHYAQKVFHILHSRSECRNGRSGCGLVLGAQEWTYPVGASTEQFLEVVCTKKSYVGFSAFSFVTPSEFVSWPCWIECDCHGRVQIIIQWLDTWYSNSHQRSCWVAAFVIVLELFLFS